MTQLSELKTNRDYQISALDYYYLASELDKKHNLKQEAVKIFSQGLADFPADFRLTFYAAETLSSIDETQARKYYQNCLRLYSGAEKNKRYEEEYKKALSIINGKAGKKEAPN